MTDSIIIYLDMDETVVHKHIISKYNILQTASTKGKYTIVRAPISSTTLTAENKKTTVRSRINAIYCIR